MVKGQGKKRASGSQPAVRKSKKTTELEDSVSPDRESVEEATAGPSVQKVLPVIPKRTAADTENEEFAKLGKLFCKPILQEVFDGTTTDKFAVIVTNRKLVGEFWHLVGRDKGHSTQSLKCVKNLTKKAGNLELPALLLVEQFQLYSVDSKHTIVIGSFAAEKLQCNLRSYIAKEFDDFPEIINAKSKAAGGSTIAVDIYDVTKDNRMVELNDKIISASLKPFKEKPGQFLVFGAQDNSGTIAGRIWEHPERYISLIKEGAVLTIANPGIVNADPMYGFKYTSNCKLEIIPNETKVTMNKSKRL